MRVLVVGGRNNIFAPRHMLP